MLFVQVGQSYLIRTYFFGIHQNVTVPITKGSFSHGKKTSLLGPFFGTPDPIGIFPTKTVCSIHR